jgi:hypothetical protein
LGKEFVKDGNSQCEFLQISRTLLCEIITVRVGYHNHIMQVAGDEIWVSFVNVETQEQLKQWMHTFTKQAE